MREYREAEPIRMRDIINDPKGMVQRVRDTQAANARWAEITDPAELREATARWLLGLIDHHPAYSGGGPEAETRPIAEALASANRGGLLTVQSQPGATGSTYVQRAFVEGYATPETTARLRAALPEGVCLVVLESSPGFLFPWSASRWGPAMSEVNNREVGHLPAYRLTRREISAEWGHRLNGEVLDQLAAMDQIYIFPGKKADETTTSVKSLYNPDAETAMWEALKRFGLRAQYGVRVMTGDIGNAWRMLRPEPAPETDVDESGDEDNESGGGAS